MNGKTGTIKLSAYHGFIASGSDISNPKVDSGYQPALVREIDRVGTDGGRIYVDAEGARDLAEFAETHTIGERDSGNSSGARSLEKLAERCIELAERLERS